MPENIRLLIWDLDETFWQGTLAEGGIQYLRENHEIVVELARRGIMSSICSKNEPAPVLKVLEKNDIFDYFVFPSISWESKGQRLLSLLETSQLRAESVMFIDDNPHNRAEAKSLVPGLQVEDEGFIKSILEDPRFRGKDDSKLTRLAQYKLLERRKRGEQQGSGNNEEFLRSCDIKIYIEYDLLSHLDRAIELVNRTNQLNFTKRRLPENIEEARLALTTEISLFSRQAGLVKVVDKYGDYGFVGFFVTETLRRDHSPGAAPLTLRHFCFSCRTLGMLIEKWVYNYLGRPELSVVGEVLTDLFLPQDINWVHQVSSVDKKAVVCAPVSPEIRVYGGCEANALGVYLGAYANKLEVLGNFRSGGLFVRINSAIVALSTFARSHEDFAGEASALGLPLELTARDYFGDAPFGTTFVFSCSHDAGRCLRYRHRRYDWELVLEPTGFPGLDFNSFSEDELASKIASVKDAELFDHILSAARHIRTNYVTLDSPSDDERSGKMAALIKRVPDGSKIVILLDHVRVRRSDGALQAAPWISKYNTLISTLAKEFPYAATFSFSDVIGSDDQVQIGGNHYDRLVYCRASQRLVSIIAELPSKGTERSVPQGILEMAGPRMQSADALIS